MSSNMRLMADFLFPTVVGAIALSEYARIEDTVYSNPTFDNHGFLLGGGILLILEAVVALACMMSTAILEFTDSFRNALFRAHEIFAVFFISPYYGIIASNSDSPDIIFAAILILLLFVIYNAIQIDDEEAGFVGSQENKMMLSRMFVSIAGLLSAIDVFGNLENTTFSNSFFSNGNVILVLITFTFGIHFFLGYFMDAEFEMQQVYVLLSTIGTIQIQYGPLQMIMSVQDGAASLETSAQLQVAAAVMAGLGVALAHFKGGEGGGFNAL